MLLAGLRPMSARYALMNLSSEPVDQDEFARAFRGVPGLTPMDAKSVGHPQFGMLIRKLTVEQATALQANLKAVGAETEIVSETTLPALCGLQLCPASGGRHRKFARTCCTFRFIRFR